MNKITKITVINTILFIISGLMLILACVEDDFAIGFFSYIAVWIFSKTTIICLILLAIACVAAYKSAFDSIALKRMLYVKICQWIIYFLLVVIIYCHDILNGHSLDLEYLLDAFCYTYKICKFPVIECITSLLFFNIFIKCKISKIHSTVLWLITIIPLADVAFLIWLLYNPQKNHGTFL